ncbi:uncharacterized protein LOC135959288 [Calliphora vicina]|uniref:uncharacterized protein LOC135959288 n=1 Tax=Calliphora vicina TaxID=7373 RepID=UPI00325AF1B7
MSKKFVIVLLIMLLIALFQMVQCQDTYPAKQVIKKCQFTDGNKNCVFKPESKHIKTIKEYPKRNELARTKYLRGAVKNCKFIDHNKKCISTEVRPFSIFNTKYPKMKSVRHVGDNCEFTDHNNKCIPTILNTSYGFNNKELKPYPKHIKL